MKYLENTMLIQLWDKIRRTFQTQTDNSLKTTSKTVVGAINEINANTVHSDKLVPTLEAITIYTDNTPEHMQSNLDNIAAYEANLQALGVDTVGIKAPIIPIYTDDSENHGFIQRNDTGLNDWTGICTAKD